MNENLIFWVRASTSHTKADCLIATMELLSNLSNTELEQVWLMYMSKVGIADNQTTFDNLQQTLLDATVEFLEQFGILISEEIDFSHQAILTRLLAGMYELDKTELREEMRGALSTDLDNIDKLIECIAIVSYVDRMELTEVLEVVNDKLISDLVDIYGQTIDDAHVQPARDERLIRAIEYSRSFETDDIVELVHNLRTPLPYRDYLNVLSAQLMEIEDSIVLAQRLVMLYVASSNETDAMQAAISRTVELFAGDGKIELEIQRAVLDEIRRLS